MGTDISSSLPSTVSQGFQVDGEFSATRLVGDPIRVIKLSDDASPWMNGATFCLGMESIYEQIVQESPQIQPALFVGLNQGGLMAAAYLEGRMFGKNDRPIGIIKTDVYTGEPTRDILYEAVPKKKLRKGRKSAIVVVDCQIKTGDSGQQIIRHLKEDKKFRDLDLRVYYAVIVACGVVVHKLRQTMTMHELFSKQYNEFCEREMEHVPDFLGFVSRKGVKPPGGIP